MRALAVGFVLLLLAPLAGAYPDPQKVPQYYESPCIAQHDRSFVYDYLGVVERDMALEIEGAACEIYATTGAHFVLVTVRDTEREPLESYALHLFEAWGIGEGERNDGLLLLYVQDYQMDGAASAARIEVGYGLEHVVNSAVAADTLDAMRSAKARSLDAGQSNEEAVSFALATGAYILLSTLKDNYVDGRFPEPTRDPFSRALEVPTIVWVIAIIVIVILVAALASSAKRPRSGWGYYHGSPQWSSGVGGAFASHVSRGGFGGGFGGGGFGGGRSGGGGGSGGI